MSASGSGAARGQLGLKLTLDEVPLTLGGLVDPAVLEAPPFNKVGVVKKILSRSAIGRTQYTAENAKLACLAEDFSIFPCTHSYLDADRRWLTRASLFLDDGRLTEFVFQVLDGRYAAGNFLDRFTEVCTTALGAPVEDGREAIVWRNGNTVVTGALHENGHDADFRFTWNGE